MYKVRRKRIGLIGSTGLVGKGALELLMEYSDMYQISLAGRSLDRMKNATKSFKNRYDIEYRLVDITNLVQLESYIKECDVIVNCAGPVSVIGDSIAKICIKLGVELADASCDQNLIEKIDKLSKDATKNKVACVIAAGIYPGLTEIIPSYIMNDKLDFTKEINMFVTGTGKLSYNASYDIVNFISNSSGTNSNTLFTYIHNGKREKVMKYLRNKEFREPINKKSIYPTISDDFYNMAYKCNADSIYFYDAYLIPLINNRYILDIDTEEKKKRAAKIMSERSECEREYSIFMAEAVGVKNNKKVEVSCEFTFDGSGESLTGMVAAAVGLDFIENGVTTYGCYCAYRNVKFGNIKSYLEKNNKVKIYEKERCI
ncbi:saccharopine dehydrogenase NADP-binding domain-containing protein [Clostridium paraputrificum]|uniref:saccharopine dehydrogenase NADP-binding domain-containing protein n=1 Tax=Clostridium paraputrificum TaxID=29363 RepID=UPI003D3321E6